MSFATLKISLAADDDFLANVLQSYFVITVEEPTFMFETSVNALNPVYTFVGRLSIDFIAPYQPYRNHNSLYHTLFL